MFHWPFELPVLHLFRFFVFYYCISPTPCHPSFLLRNLYASQEATLRTFHGTTDQFKTGKGVRQGCILSSCLFKHVQSTSCDMLGWMSYKLESRLPGLSITSDMQMTPPLCRKQRGTNEPLDEGEREE